MSALCVVCSTSSYKYTCPKCLIKYCSVPCYKEHKEKCQEEAERLANEVEKELENQEIPPVDVNELYLPTEDTVSQEKLSMLKESEPLRILLRNSELRGQVEALSSCSDEEEAQCLLDGLMENDLFRGFASACFRVVEPGFYQEHNLDDYITDLLKKMNS